MLPSPALPRPAQATQAASANLCPVEVVCSVVDRAPRHRLLHGALTLRLLHWAHRLGAQRQLASVVRRVERHAGDLLAPAALPGALPAAAAVAPARVSGHTPSHPIEGEV